MDINRKQILKSLLEVIEGISDKEYQIKVWIRGEGSEIDDFDETTCNFFQDGNGVIQNYKQFGLTDHQHQILLKFRDKFHAFVYGDHPYLPEDFIDTSEWEAITVLAKEVLEAFNYKKEP